MLSIQFRKKGEGMSETFSMQKSINLEIVFQISVIQMANLLTSVKITAHWMVRVIRCLSIIHNRDKDKLRCGGLLKINLDSDFF